MAEEDKMTTPTPTPAWTPTPTPPSYPSMPLSSMQMTPPPPRKAEPEVSERTETMMPTPSQFKQMRPPGSPPDPMRKVPMLEAIQEDLQQAGRFLQERIVVIATEDDLKQSDARENYGFSAPDGFLTKKEVDNGKSTDATKILLKPHFEENGIDPTKDYKVNIEAAARTFASHWQDVQEGKKPVSATTEIAIPPAEKGGTAPSGP